MHLLRNAFSMTGLPTITPLSSSPAFLGQHWKLSRSDIARVNKLYKCSRVAMQPGKELVVLLKISTANCEEGWEAAA